MQPNLPMPGTIMQDKDEYTFDELIDDAIDLLGDLTALDEEEIYISRFKFFTPYEDALDFSYTLTSPIIETFILAVRTILAAIITVLAPFACLAFLAVSFVALFIDDEICIEAFSLSLMSAYAFFSFAYQAVALALMTVIEPFARAASIITRTGASLVAMCCDGDDEEAAVQPQMTI